MDVESSEAQVARSMIRHIWIRHKPFSVSEPEKLNRLIIGCLQKSVLLSLSLKIFTRIGIFALS